VFWITGGEERGAFFVAAKASTAAAVAKLANELGVSFEARSTRADGDAIRLRRPRIALADVYGGSMPSGWTRWLLEQYEFPFDVVFPKALDADDLASRYDVIIFSSGVGPVRRSLRSAQPATTAQREEPNVPEEYQQMLGTYSDSDAMAQLQKFVEAGGTVVAVGRSSMNLAQVFDLPASSYLTERSPDGTTRPLPSEKYYVPGSVLRVAVDNTTPVAHGVTNPVDVFFDNSPVFRLEPDAAMKGVRPLAWFDTATPLRSGWAYGQGYLEGGVAALEASVGKGRLFLFGPEITFRAQPHGTFKFLFNGLFLAAERGVTATDTNVSR
jgi:hypothetical protein